MNQYYPGQAVTLVAQFFVDGVLKDPDGIRVSVRNPDHEVVVFDLADLARVEVGVYSRDVVVDVPGVWYYRCEGEGVIAAQEGAFEVLETKF